MMARRLAMAVLVMHMVVSALAIPIAISVLALDYRPILFVILVQFLALGALRTPGGRKIGWIAEALALVLAIGSWAWFSMNLVFIVLWFYALRWGDRIDDFQSNPPTA
jgi:riboflavin transporter FmnP